MKSKATLVVWCFCAVSSPLFAGLAQDEAEFNALAAKSREEQKICEAHHDRAKKAAGELVVTKEDGPPIFSSRAAALRTLPLLLNYPGFPPSSAKAIEKFTSVPSLAETDLTKTDELGSCRTLGYYRLFQSMVLSAKKYGFTDDEKKKVREESLAYVKKDLAGPMWLIDIMVKLAVADELWKSDLWTISAEQKNRLLELSKESERRRHLIRDEYKDLNDMDLNPSTYAVLKAETKIRLGQKFQKEQVLSDNLRNELRAILKTIEG